MVIFETAIPGASTRGLTAAQIQRFVRRVQTLVKVKGKVDILISSNTRLRDLNRRFRHKNKPTDVLSFPVSPAATSPFQPTSPLKTHTTMAMAWRKS